VSAALAVLLVVAVVLTGSDADAGPGDIDTTYVPIDPCRLFDLRPDGGGDRTSPLGPGEVYTQPVVGAVGECNLPADASGVMMNVTIVEPTAASHLTIYPANRRGIPQVSSLNWVAGQAPTPNAVDVKLSPDGRLKFYNLAGQVYVLADVVGYHTDKSLDAISSDIARLSREKPSLLPTTSWESPPSGLHKISATATIDLDTDGVDAGTCTIEPSTDQQGNGIVEYSIERVVGTPVEFSDEGIPESQARFPVNVVQVFHYQREAVLGDGVLRLSFSIDCTAGSGAFDVLDNSIIWEHYPNGTFAAWALP